MPYELTPQINYGPVRRGQPYRILDKGRDYYLVSAQGKGVYVPMHIFEHDDREFRPILCSNSISDIENNSENPDEDFDDDF